ncbi:hypothetical protein PINS_up007890 [Pythium insidiosum]|nr:hypothetical protein PINS_up007890 [Pythium insidiosum]
MTQQHHKRSTIAKAIGLFALLVSTALLAFHGSDVHRQVRAEREKHRVLRQLQSLASLKIHFHVKRESMAVHGQRDFDVLANPILSSGEGDDAQKRLTYEGVAAFQQNGVIHKYVLANSIFYYSKAQGDSASENTTCVSPSALPSIGDILKAINEARSVYFAPDSPQKLHCPLGSLLEFHFAGDMFVLCSTTESGGLSIMSSDLDIQVSFLSSPVSIPTPTLSADKLAQCERAQGATTVNPSTLSLLQGTATSLRRRKRADDESVVMAEASCSCKGPKRPCIFFHGLGNKAEGPLQDTSSYFGSRLSAPCCTQIKYAQLDTVNAGWNDRALQRKVCDLALSVGKNTGRTIENTIIVAHSMGNLMLAGAIANDVCKLGASSTWVGLSGPMRGSMGSDYMQDACSGQGNGLVGSVASLFGKCPADTATKLLAYEGEKYVSSALKAEYDAAQEVYTRQVGAAMCSNGNSGIFSTSQLVYLTAGAVIPHKTSEHDGVVEFQSCAADLSRDSFGSTFDSKRYVTKLNHVDTAFRHGDALWDNAKKPVKWFECLL